MLLLITLQILQQLQSPPLNITTDQFQVSLERGEQTPNQTLSSRLISYHWPTQNAIKPTRVSSLEVSSQPIGQSQVSSLPQQTDMPEKTKKTWLQQVIDQFQSSFSLAKNRVSVLNRQVRLYKYRLSDLATQSAGPAGGELLAAFAFGSVKSLEVETKNNLKILGLLHVASASGFNVAIITSLVQGGTSWLKTTKLRFIILVVALFCYADLAEFSASIVRASLGTGYKLFGELWLNRPTHPLLALIFSAITMAGLNPSYLSNLSFQLSCLATLGLTCFGQINSVAKPTLLGQSLTLLLPVRTDGLQPHVATQSRWWGRVVPFLHTGYRRITQTLSDSFWTSVAAQILVMPLLWWRFGDWSPLSLVANPLLLWLTPYITQLSLALVVVTAWADRWPLEVCWYIQHLLGTVLNFTAQVFQSGVVGLSQAEPWLASHSWFRHSIVGWWLLSGFVVVKTLGRNVKMEFETF